MQCFPTGLFQQLKWNKNVCYNKLDIENEEIHKKKSETTVETYPSTLFLFHKSHFGNRS